MVVNYGACRFYGQFVILHLNALCLQWALPFSHIYNYKVKFPYLMKELAVVKSCVRLSTGCIFGSDIFYLYLLILKKNSCWIQT